MDTKKEKSNNASKATKRLSEGQFKKKKKKKKKIGKLKATWIQKRKKQRRPQIF